jgi:hypothetical protein
MISNSSAPPDCFDQFSDHGDGLIVERRIAPEQQGTVLSVRQFLVDQTREEFALGVMPDAHRLPVAVGECAPLRASRGDDPIVRLAQIAFQDVVTHPQ